MFREQVADAGMVTVQWYWYQTALGLVPLKLGELTPGDPSSEGRTDQEESVDKDVEVGRHNEPAWIRIVPEGELHGGCAKSSWMLDY